MKIYVGHSKDLDYINNLYIPVREVEKEGKDNYYLPHEDSPDSSNKKEFYSDIDLFIAEVSYPSTGLGIELGMAYLYEIPIVCISKTGSKVSSSLKFVTDKFYEYKDNEELKKLIREIVEENRR
jgi:hypothetical protein